MKYAWYCSEDHGDTKTSYLHGGYRKNRKTFDNAFNQAKTALFNKCKRRNAQGNLGEIPINEIFWTISGPMMPDSKEPLTKDQIEKIVEEKGFCQLRPTVPSGDRIQGWIRIETMEHKKAESQWLIDSMKKDCQEYADQDGKTVTITNGGGLGSVTSYPNEPSKQKYIK